MSILEKTCTSFWRENSNTVEISPKIWLFFKKKITYNIINILLTYNSFFNPFLGIPAVDPVLKRAQFNQKVINMTQHEEANRIRMSKRPVSMETRRFAGKCFEQKNIIFHPFF